MGNEKSAEVVDMVPAPRPQGLAEIDPLTIIERRNQMLERLLNYAIRATHAGQWVDQQGKPFPTAAAAEVMARRCAVRISNVRSKKIDSQDTRGAFYFYLVEATASLPGEWDSLEAMGTCSSRDQFLGTETSAGRDISEIDEGNILKAAYSNLIVNAVTRLLGVRNLTWEMLATLDISKDGAARVNYKSGSKGGGRGQSSDDVELRFGRSKGQKLSEVSDEDVRWYLGVWQKDATDPEKAKYKANCERSIRIAEAILAARAGKTSGDSANGAGKRAYDRVLDLAAGAGLGKDAAHEWLKGRGRFTPTAVVEDDAGAFEQWLSERAEGF